MPSRSRPGERHISAYLRYLQDPTSARDEEAVRRAEAAVENAEDPIAKVYALSELERVKAVDGAALEAAFIEHVETWAEATGATHSALLSVGVPPQVLLKAGIDVPAVSVRRRRPNVGLDELYASLDPGKPFSASDLAAAWDRPVEAMHKWLRRLAEEDLIVLVGPDPDHKGRGRGRILYRKAPAK